MTCAALGLSPTPFYSFHAAAHVYIPIRFLATSTEGPATRITLFRSVWPEAMVMEERGTFKNFARNSTQARFALPSIGGAVRESLSASPSSPLIAFFLARGWTFTANVTPSPD